MNGSSVWGKKKDKAQSQVGAARRGVWGNLWESDYLVRGLGDF